LGFVEINAVLLLVNLALGWIILKLHSVWKIYRYVTCRKSYFSIERSSAGTAGAGVSVETGWWVKVTESMADRTAPAVAQPRLVWLAVVIAK